MTNLVIREAESKDHDGIVQIFDSHKHRGEENWDKDAAKLYFDEFFKNKNTSQDKVFVGTVDDNIVSVIGYYPERSENVKDVFWVGWFYTHETHGKKGYGKALLNHVISELKDKKARKLFVNTSSNDFYEPAVSLYLRMGFKQEGTLEDFYEKGESRLIFGMNL